MARAWIRGMFAGIVATSAVSSIARADPAPTTQEAEPKHRLNWTYPRFRVWQYAASAAVTVTGLYLEYGIKGDFPDGAWDHGILFDNSVRHALASSDPAARNQAASLSDTIWPITQYYPIVVDSLIVPLATDKLNADVALQMNLINWQAEGLAFTLLRVAHRTVGRARPSLESCADNPKYDGACSPDATGRTASFYSGHATMTATAAGLVCAHHQALPLYGGNAADGLICGAAIGSSLMTGMLRIVADKHWTSDVMTGWITGGVIGYGIPYFLHYRHGRPEPLGAGVLPADTAIIPRVSSTELGLGWIGVF